MFIVYKHENKINHKVYIGITSQKPELRWENNGCNYNSSPHFFLTQFKNMVGIILNILSYLRILQKMKRVQKNKN